MDVYSGTAASASTDAACQALGGTWADGAAYDAKATQLASEFHANFEQFAEDAPDEVAAAGPKAGR